MATTTEQQHEQQRRKAELEAAEKAFAAAADRYLESLRATDAETAEAREVAAEVFRETTNDEDTDSIATSFGAWFVAAVAEGIALDRESARTDALAEEVVRLARKGRDAAAIAEAIGGTTEEEVLRVLAEQESLLDHTA